MASGAAAKRVAVMAIGRFQPPTIGHREMIREVIARAKREGGDAFVFTTTTHGGERYPLEVEDKVRLLKKMFPDREELRVRQTTDAFHAAASLKDDGYTRIIWFAGSDRVDNYRRLLSGKGFEGVHGTVVELERDPDSDDLTASISGTVMREYAVKRNVAKFKEGLNNSVHENAENIMKKIRASVGEGGAAAAGSKKGGKSKAATKKASGDQGGGGRAARKRRTRRRKGHY